MDPGSHFLMSSKLEYEYVEISVCMDQALGKVEDKGLFLPLLLPPKGVGCRPGRTLLPLGPEPSARRPKGT